MQGGFSFCGVDIGRLGLEYVPTIEDAYIYSGSTYSLSEEAFEGHHGGYFFGTTVEPKIFSLRCMFQEKNINHGLLSTIESFFRRGRTGKLIFEKNDWLWYSATVVEIDTSSLINYMNGFVTITLKAYYPFGRCDSVYLTDGLEFNRSIIENTGLLNQEMTPANQFGVISENTSFLLYNGGNEYAACAIELAGSAGSGVTIVNHTTGQKARFVCFSRDDTTDAGKTIISDALNGKTVLTNGKDAELKFIYHDSGFIELAPSFPIERSVLVNWKSNSDRVTGLDVFDLNMIGKFIYICGKWRKIISVIDSGTIQINDTVSKTGTGITSIVTMNEMSVELGADAALTTLNFRYSTTFK